MYLTDEGTDTEVQEFLGYFKTMLFVKCLQYYSCSLLTMIATSYLVRNSKKEYLQSTISYSKYSNSGKHKWTLIAYM